MSGIDRDQLDAAFDLYGGGDFTILDADSTALPKLPVQWRGVVGASSAEERRRAALASWNDEFLGLLPRFADALHTRLLDVRAISSPAEDQPMLVYILSGAADPYALWIGWSPTSSGSDDPPFFEALPAPAQTFLRDVHAGFSAPDAESCGLTPPSDMTTMAQWAECPDGIPDWDGYGWEDCAPIDSRRLLRVTGYGADYSLCVSPDLPAGQALAYSDGELHVRPFAAELDRIMSLPVEV